LITVVILIAQESAYGKLVYVCFIERHSGNGKCVYRIDQKSQILPTPSFSALVWVTPFEFMEKLCDSWN